ncbi:MAG: hypothetical protein A2001_01630 [Treponema sp. GWC1_61_84]|nr:MAG: hypothetical protein A2001_01630 [Treponema sp. GWC1_61_84]
MKPKNTALAITAIFIITFSALFFFTGLLVIQPIGAIPEGATIWYSRTGLNVGFVVSPDGELGKKGGVSLMGRAMMMMVLQDLTKDRVIAKLPYSKTLYLISTGGTEYGQ